MITENSIITSEAINIVSSMNDVIRCVKNPIIKPSDVVPSDVNYEVVGVFNPGVTMFNGKILLLLRVAQRPKDLCDGFLRVPIYSNKNKRMEIMKFDKNDETIDFSDSRVITLSNGKKYLTSFSFFKIATSIDGENFIINQDANILPSSDYEAFGIEDARISKIDDTYYINYSAASDYGIVTSLMTTKDFITFEKKGNIMYPDNKDVSIFPEKIDNYYYALHRPSTSEFGKPEMWVAKSPDLVCWGEHRHLMSVVDGKWDSKRIGASSIPMRTNKGWLVVYHGADNNNKYCLGCCLLDLQKPWQVLGRSAIPFLTPQAEYEKAGFFKDVVFSCGCIQNENKITIYYGAADMYICKADIQIDELMKNFKTE